MVYRILAEPHVSQWLITKEQFPVLFMTLHLLVFKTFESNIPTIKACTYAPNRKNTPVTKYFDSWGCGDIDASQFPTFFLSFSNVIGVHLLQNLQV